MLILKIQNRFIICKRTLSYFACALLFQLVCFSLYGEEERLNKELALCFENVAAEHIKTTLLKGGYSQTHNYLVECAGKKYVLRLFSPERSEVKIEREICDHLGAASIGIAPKIYYISADRYALLMEYISGGTLLLSQAKQPEQRQKIAQAIRKIHCIPCNPYPRASIRERMQSLYDDIYPLVSNKSLLEEAQRILNSCYAALPPSPYVTLHGDLNPHNIFCTKQNIYFIDWSDSNRGDCFQDVSTFVAFQGYSLEEENAFLREYLCREPTTEEYERYYILKKIAFAHLCITCQTIVLDEIGNDEINTTITPKPWYYYAHLFAEGSEKFTAQTFYEASRAALIESKKIPCCVH